MPKPQERDLEQTKVTFANWLELKLENINNLNVELLGRGIAWFDTGTFDSLQDASSYIRMLENRQGLKVGCPEEVAWRQGWIDSNHLKVLAESFSNSGYGNYLLQLLD